MGSDIALAVVGKIVEKTVDPIVNTVVRQCSYVFCYKQNTQTLRVQLDDLDAMRSGVQLSTDEAERNLEIVDPSMTRWLGKVDDIKSRALVVREGTSNVEKGCLNGWCPNLKQRYLLSRKATKLNTDIDKLITNGKKYPQFSHPARPLGIVPPVDPSISSKDDGFKGFATRIATMNELMDALKNDDINLIGISGMGGVGKTTLVKQVLEKVTVEGLFDEVPRVVVSQQPNVVKIQGEIAQQLGLTLSDGSSDARAERLCERLQKSSKVLVFLDDIWEQINLGEVGIPAAKGCKVVFTTRMEGVCNEMEVQGHITVQMLSQPEAWDLFRKEAGDCVEDEDLRGIAKEVAQECGGLPIAVVTLGKALSKRKKHEWEDTRLKLKKSSGIDGKVKSSIMLSYDFLKSRTPEAQPLLLLCTLFREDENIQIEWLVKYSMGLDQLSEDVQTLEETRNRVYTLVDNLKFCNLLLQGDGKYADLCVKLHDVVRDVCMSIASNPPHAYLVRHDKELKQWPQQNRHKADLTAIVLKSSAMNELPGGLDYPNLRLLQLQLKHDEVNIAGDFFQGMRGLQVFSYDGKRAEDYCASETRSGVILPPTIQLLTSLQTLSFEGCILSWDASSIGFLKELKILSFYDSRLKKFPRDLGGLKNLKLLDLRCIFDDIGVNIETCVLSGLDQLEVLYLGGYVFSESIKELNSLSCLTTLQISVANSIILLEMEKSFFDRLIRFDIHIGLGGGGYSCGEYGLIRNNITLYYDELSWVWHTKLGFLVRRSHSFTVYGLDEDRFMWDERESGLSALVNLESLAIQSMYNLIEMSPDSKIPQGSFPRLQELYLEELPALKHMWMGPAQPPSFANLRLLEISECVSVESLFSPNVAKCMVKLEDLKIRDCERLKGVVSNQGKEDGDKGVDMIQFPKLKSILFYQISDFKSFFYQESGNEDVEGNSGIKQSLFNQWVSFPSLEEIYLEAAESLEHIVGYQMLDGPPNMLRSIDVSFCEVLKDFVHSTTLENLEKVRISSCDSMEVVFDLEGQKVGGEDSPFVFDKLTSIRLNKLKKLAHVWRTVPDGIQGFRYLTTLNVESCNDLKYLMSYTVAKMLVNLQVLNLIYCPEIVGVIGGEHEEECSGEAKSNECIVFPQLQDLTLYMLESLTSFCSSKCSLEFPALNNVDTRGCPDMKSFCGGEVKAPVLKEPVEDPYGEQWFWQGNLNNGNYRVRREVEVEVEDESETFYIEGKA